MKLPHIKLPKLALHWWIAIGVVALLVIQKNKVISDQVTGGTLISSGKDCKQCSGKCSCSGKCKGQCGNTITCQLTSEERLGCPVPKGSVKQLTGTTGFIRGVLAGPGVLGELK
jgi:hypothetical protein